MKIAIVVGNNDLVFLDEIKKTISKSLNHEDFEIEIIRESEIQKIENMTGSEMKRLLDFKNNVSLDQDEVYSEWKSEVSENLNTMFRKQGVLNINKVLKRDRKGKVINNKKRGW